MGVPAPTTGAKVRSVVVEHRQGTAVAACVLLVLACLWPALAPVWTSPPVTLAARVPPPERAPLPVATMSLLPVPPPADQAALPEAPRAVVYA
jgi:hypothetical protein